MLLGSPPHSLELTPHPAVFNEAPIPRLCMRRLDKGRRCQRRQQVRQIIGGLIGHLKKAEEQSSGENSGCSGRGCPAAWNTCGEEKGTLSYTRAWKVSGERPWQHPPFPDCAAYPLEPGTPDPDPSESQAASASFHSSKSLVSSQTCSWLEADSGPDFLWESACLSIFRALAFCHECCLSLVLHPSAWGLASLRMAGICLSGRQALHVRG